jgi:hypothetical protein
MLIPQPGTDQTKLVIFVCSLRPIFMSIVHGQRSRGRLPEIFLLGASTGRPCPRRPCRACSTTRPDYAPLHTGAHCHSLDTLVTHCSHNKHAGGKQSGAMEGSATIQTRCSCSSPSPAATSPAPLPYPPRIQVHIHAIVLSIRQL